MLCLSRIKSRDKRANRVVPHSRKEARLNGRAASLHPQTKLSRVHMAESYVTGSAREAAAAAELAASRKQEKYASMSVPSPSKPWAVWSRQTANSVNLGRKISSTSGDESSLYCSREFRCWCNATKLFCYMTPCQPLTAQTVVCTQLYIILIFKLAREHIYRG